LSKSEFLSCNNYNIEIGEFKFMENEHFETLQRSLGVTVTFTSKDFNNYFISEFGKNCKKFIPKAQATEIIYKDIASALFHGYEYTFQFDYLGQKYDFSFTGGWSNNFKFDWNDAAKAGKGLVIYHPIITISKDELVVFKQQDDIQVNAF
jgi:hypothetical protein